MIFKPFRTKYYGCEVFWLNHVNTSNVIMKKKLNLIFFHFGLTSVFLECHKDWNLHSKCTEKQIGLLFKAAELFKAWLALTIG